MAGERILVAEDESLLRHSIVDQLEAEGYRVTATGSAGDARREVERGDYDLALFDFRLPDGNGLELLKASLDKSPEAPVVLMTAYSSVENAVEAMRLGAYDYLNKPFDMDELGLVLAKALETTQLRREVQLYTSRQRQRFGLQRIIGESACMVELLDQVRRIIDSGSSTVLIRGESGTGKDLLAKAIHYESERARAPFVNVTCTAIPDTLLESELFGHERGAFTGAHQKKVGLFELARGGTVFLDEIGDMPQGLQGKLLRFLEDRTFKRVGGTQDISVDVRIVAATNADLEAAVEDGRFREDLYYRLKVIPLELPPLRARRDDIPQLVKAFLVDVSRDVRRQFHGIEPSAMEALTRYDWPGNVRELRNVMERALILGRGDVLRLGDLPREVRAVLGDAEFPVAGTAEPLPVRVRVPGEDDRQDAVSGGDSNGRTHTSAAAPVDTIPVVRGGPSAADRERFGTAACIVLPPEGLDWEDVERALVIQAVERTDGNQSRAAKLLGLSRDQLRYRMQRFGMLPQPPAREEKKHKKVRAG
jgi:DNA-binding NtrC family response regulator